jgi:transketolase
MTDFDPDQLCIGTIRGLCMDMVQRADSGHPGTPISMAPVAYTLWQEFLRYDPADAAWPNRDRFVLSAGHASALLWSLLHLAGVRSTGEDGRTPGDEAVTLDDIKGFRQLGSKCPGHPEYRWTSGVEATTGPLGQGAAMSVGMAVARDWLAATYNRPGHTLFDFDVYALAGDGCMMEGISAEAASFAGHQRLSNLCWIYDSNRITIEGHTEITFTEDVAARFIGYGWNVTSVADANDTREVARALHAFKAEDERPTLIIVHSHIGYGSPVEDMAKAHGEPLGVEGVKSTKAFLGLRDEDFFVPDGVQARFAEGVGARGADARAAWQETFASYRSAHPDFAHELDMMQRGHMPVGWQSRLADFPADAKGLATRESSGRVLNEVARQVPWIIGGAADLAPSTKTTMTFDGAGVFSPEDRAGRNFHFGVREHATAAIVNGMALTKVRPFWASFFVFSDYARTSIRLSALMEIPVVHIFTHDSIGVGEDGPTHQPIEQLASLRAMPGILVFRPADANEVAETWKVVAELTNEPAILVLTRQALPTLDRSVMGAASGVSKGAYVVADADGGDPDVLLIATGSEVQLALSAREELAGTGIRARVVSMPCWELFDRQPKAYRDEVLPPGVRPRVAVELGTPFGWERYVGDDGAVVGMTTFGSSAPLKDLLAHFGFTAARVAEVARERVAAERSAQ